MGNSPNMNTKKNELDTIGVISTPRCLQETLSLRLLQKSSECEINYTVVEKRKVINRDDLPDRCEWSKWILKVLFLVMLARLPLNVTVGYYVFL